ncbi:MAG: prolyl oligopeptidase family serine peptidase [Pyrinomonadaceae bacterium]
MKRLFCLFLFALFAFFSVNAQQYTVQDLMKIRRVGDPQLSPGGKQILYTIGDVDLAANKILTQIYEIPVTGGEIRQVTRGDKSNSSPRWSPDGKKIAFATGGQIWTMNADGGDRKQITRISTDAANPVWSPDGKWIAFVSDVYPDCANDVCNQKRDEEAENSKVKAKVIDRLLYRHWTEWRNVKRTHVFVVSSDGGAAARDMTIGDFDSPPYAASSNVDFAFSPDSKELAYLRNPDKVEAISTNSDIFIVPINGGAAKDITVTNKGYDVSPAYTSDGKYIIYRSQMTEGFESDRWRIMRYDRQTGQSVELTRGFDNQVSEFVISRDNKTIYFTSNVNGLEPIYSVPVEPDFRLRIATFVKPVVATGFNSNLNVSADGNNLVFLSNSMNAPSEVFRASVASGSTVNLSNANAVMNFQKPDNIKWTGALGAEVHGFLLKPRNFDPNKKYPLFVLIHGGPQGATNDNWSFRWNPQIFAGEGYVVFMPNPRGSTGYGQKFVNDISGDWGGKPFTDIMNGVASVLQKNSYIDRSRIGASGASYGGYMIDWIQGHNADPRFHFKVLHSHAGVYNLESMAGTTEELWFVNHEFNGMPWENPQMYARWSPSNFVKNFNTPMLVTQGEIDYRVPVNQSLELFTALQRRGVESKLIIFPDEGHWILKPQDSVFWYGQVLDWFGKHLNP